MMKYRKLPFAKQVIYLSIPWILFFGLLEGLTRILYEKPNPGGPLFSLTMSEADSTRVWRYKTNYRQTFKTDEFEIEIRTNSWGLRDEEVEINDSDLRILVLGNSFTFGWGVDQNDRYTELLESELRRRLPDRRIQVLNAGHWMYTFDQQFLLMKELIPKYKPHMVIQELYGPHIFTISEHEWLQDQDGTLTAVRYKGFANEIVVNEDGSLKRTNMFIENPPLSSRFVAKVLQRYFRWRQLREAPVNMISLFGADDNSNENAWKMTRATIQETGRYLHSLNIDYVAFNVPTAFAVNKQEWPSWFSEQAKGQSLDLDLPTQEFAVAVQEAGGEWLELTSTFRKDYEPDLYFHDDPHWTEKGHQLAASKLIDVVLERFSDQTH